MSRAKGGAVKPVKCYAWIEDDRIEQAFVSLRSVRGVLTTAPPWTGGRWAKVEIRPVPQKRKRKETKRKA